MSSIARARPRGPMRPASGRRCYTRGVPRVFPFRSLVYDPAVAGPLDRVTAPPYDVISEARLRELQTEPSNIVRVDLAKDAGSGEDRYQAAGELLRRWTAEGVLRREEPAFHAYEMRTGSNGRLRSVRGVFAAMELESWGGNVLPHEETMPGPVEDRLQPAPSRADASVGRVRHGGRTVPCPGRSPGPNHARTTCGRGRRRAGRAPSSLAHRGGPAGRGLARGPGVADRRWTSSLHHCARVPRRDARRRRPRPLGSPAHLHRGRGFRAADGRPVPPRATLRRAADGGRPCGLARGCARRVLGRRHRGGLDRARRMATSRFGW